MTDNAAFKSLIIASLASTLALNYFGWRMADFMPAEHVRLLDWQGYFSILNHEELRNFIITIMVIEFLGIAGMLLKPLFFRNILLLSMILWVMESLAGGYHVSTPLMNMLSSIQHIFISLTLGFAYFSDNNLWQQT